MRVLGQNPDPVFLEGRIRVKPTRIRNPAFEEANYALRPLPNPPSPKPEKLHALSIDSKLVLNTAISPITGPDSPDEYDLLFFLLFISGAVSLFFSLFLYEGYGHTQYTKILVEEGCENSRI